MNNKKYRLQLENIKNQWICNKPIAHRGIWDNTAIFENTLSAFENAVRQNFAIETDVWIIKDGTLVIFHDDTLERLCGVKKNIWDVETLEELKSYTIMGKDKIPTFDEFLSVVDGKTEILVEIKTYKFNGITEKAIYERMKNYNGIYAIESFNFYSVWWYKKHAPEIIRGQLSSTFERNNASALVYWVKCKVTKLGFEKYVKSHFIAYDKKYFPNKYTDKAKRQNKAIILWTIKNQQEYDDVKNIADNIIFDSFIPE